MLLKNISINYRSKLFILPFNPTKQPTNPIQFINNIQSQQQQNQSKIQQPKKQTQKMCHSCLPSHRYSILIITIIIFGNLQSGYAQLRYLQTIPPFTTTTSTSTSASPSSTSLPFPLTNSTVTTSTTSSTPSITTFSTPTTIQSTNPGNPTIVRVIANTQGNNTQSNTTTKTTVNIPQSVLNTLNTLANKGIITGDSVNSSNPLNPLSKYAILSSNDPLAALSSISSSSLVPIVTKVTTINNTVSNIATSKSDNIAGVYNVNDGTVTTTQLAPGASVFAGVSPAFSTPVNGNVNNGQVAATTNPSLNVGNNVASNTVTSTFIDPNTGQPILAGFQPVQGVPAGYYPQPYPQPQPQFQPAPVYPQGVYPQPQVVYPQGQPVYAQSPYPQAVLPQQPIYPQAYPTVQGYPYQPYPYQTSPTYGYNPAINSYYPLTPPPTLNPNYPPYPSPYPTVYNPNNLYPSITASSPTYNPNLAYPIPTTNTNIIPTSPGLPPVSTTTVTGTPIVDPNSGNTYLPTSSVNLPIPTASASASPPVSNSLASVFNPLDSSSGISPSNSPEISASTTSALNSISSGAGNSGQLTSSVISNLILGLLPSLSLYGQQKTTNNPTGNLNQSRNLSVNLANSDQSLNLHSSIPSSTGQPDFSIKLEQSAKKNTNSTNAGVNYNQFSNVDSVNQQTTVLSVYTGKNAINLNGNGNGNNNSNNAPTSTQQQQQTPSSNTNSITNTNTNTNQPSTSTSTSTPSTSTSSLNDIPLNQLPTLSNSNSNPNDVGSTNNNNNINNGNTLLDNGTQVGSKIFIPVLKPFNYQPQLSNINNNKNNNNPSKSSSAKPSTSTTTTISTPYKLPTVSQITLSYTDYLKKYKPSSSSSSSTISPQILKLRQQTYLKNLALINKFNTIPTRTFNMGLNPYTDITQSQFTAKHTKLTVPQDIKKMALTQIILLDKDSKGNIKYPKPQNITIDWSCYTQQIPIDSGLCSPSWIINSLQSIQITARFHKINVGTLNIQELLSCGKNTGKIGNNINLNGCGNGFMTGSFDYVRNFGVGVSTNISVNIFDPSSNNNLKTNTNSNTNTKNVDQSVTNYYYDSKAQIDGQASQCNTAIIKNKNYEKSKFFIKISRRVLYGDCKQVVNQLKTRSLAASISTQYLQFYAQGTYSLPFPSTSSGTNPTFLINHGVTLIGYNPTNGYLIKNSWGNTWGMNGYAYVSQSMGVCDYAMYPVLNTELKANEINLSCNAGNVGK